MVFAYFWACLSEKRKTKVVSLVFRLLIKARAFTRFVKTHGSSSDPEEVNRLFLKGKQEIVNHTKQTSLNFEQETEQNFIHAFIKGIETFSLVGPELLLGRLFDEIGFNAIDDDLLRHLVIARLVYPSSKLKTVDYLFKCKGITLYINKRIRKAITTQTNQFQPRKSYSHHAIHLCIANNNTSICRINRINNG